MECPQCGTDVQEGAGACEKCGTVLSRMTAPAPVSSSPVTPPPSPVNEPVSLPSVTPVASLTAPNPRRWVKPTVIGLLLFAMLAVAAVVVEKQFFPVAAPLSRLLPADTAFVVTADTPWWWGNLKSVREQPQTRAALQRMESEMGISIEKDVIPWAGQLGVAVLDFQQRSPQMLMMLEIHDRAAFLKALPNLLAHMERKSGTAWTETNYNGVTLREGTVDQHGMQVKVASAHFSGWFVMSIGEGIMQKSIDASKSDGPALQDNEAWVKALAQAPSRHIAFFGLNGKQMGKLIGALNPMATTALANSGLDSMVGIGTLNPTAQGLRLDTLSIIAPGPLQTQRKALKTTHLITGKALAQLPQGTMLAIELANPGQFWQNFQQQLLNTPEGRQLGPMLTQVAPVGEILANCTGEFALGVAWTPEHGFGVVALEETASTNAAQQQAARLSRFITTLHQQVTARDGGYQLALPVGDAEFPTQLSWSGKGAWFKFSTQPAYLTGAGQTLLQYPAGTPGADSAFVLDLKSLPAIAKHFDAKAGTHEVSNVVDTLELGKMQMRCYGTIGNDGGSEQGVFEINNWDWKNLLKIGALLPNNAGGLSPLQPRSTFPASPPRGRPHAQSAVTGR